MKREERDELLLQALAACDPMTGEWVEAAAVARKANERAGFERDERLSSVGVGQGLSRLAGEGRCRKRLDGYMNRYRSVV